ncbi:MAG: ChbG/HpnK family deacetylase [Candidatus Gastranaerophilales bacterium]|nr:ChbG/HpnK family deacetylase [Candidatus Gastranaerophilales bacterium]
MKKLIFNSDDFGYSTAFNQGIKKGFQAGVLSSTCILANGDAFENAVEIVKNEIPNIGLGIHLNIIEGKSLTDCPLLTDPNGIFNNSYGKMIKMSYNEKYMQQVESELRAQIEKIKSQLNVDHINSHVHTHAIPNMFRLTTKLANEYEIKNIRTQFEKPYIIPDLKKHLSKKYPLNIIKNMLLNSFSIINKQTLKQYNLVANDYLIGVTYTGYMDENAIIYGLKAIKAKNCIAEILIHPTYYAENEFIEKPFNHGEFLLTQSPTIIEKINAQNWQKTSYKDLETTQQYSQHSYCH